LKIRSTLRTILNIYIHDPQFIFLNDTKAFFKQRFLQSSGDKTVSAVEFFQSPVHLPIRKVHQVRKSSFFSADSFLLQPTNLKFRAPFAIALLYNLMVSIIPASQRKKNGEIIIFNI